MNIDTLRQQHDELESMAASLLAAVSSEKRQTIGSLRWRLARALMGHLAVEDRYLYPAMMNSGDAKISAMAAEFQSEMGGLAEAFAAYMSKWNDDAIIADWPSFCRDSKAVLAALGDRIARENRVMYPLAETISSHASRAARPPLAGESAKAADGSA